MHLSRESKQARGTDRKLFERWFHNHRTTFLELFPEGEEVLRRHGVPVTTLS